MRLAVGDVVVYAAYGLGRVTARNHQLVRGTEQEVIVLEFDEGLTVSLPLERAQQQLRAPATETELRQVQETLRTQTTVSTQPWLARQRQTEAKLTNGEPLGLAEIVRDGAARQRSLTTNGGKSALSEGERRVWLRARQLLSNEIGLVRGVSASEADDWIDQQLAKHSSS